MSSRTTTTGGRQIGVAFSGHRRLVREVDGRTERVDAAPGVVYVTGPSAIRWLEVHEPVEALEVYPDQALLEQAAGGPVEVAPAFAAPDGTMFALATLLRGVHLGRTGMTDVAASTLAHRVALHVVERHVRGGAVPRPHGRLSARQIDTVAQFVAANLAQPLTLDALAGALALSPFHFARGFKSATGLTPHAFTTAQRLNRAKDLLLRSGQAVAEVAYEVGFSNLAHFRRLFRREFGVNPSQLREHHQST